MPIADAGAASVTVGRNDLSTISGTETCDSASFCAWFGTFNTALVTPGDQLSAPADGVITGWRVRGTTTSGGALRLHVVRPVAGQYLGIADTVGATNVTGALPNAASLAVKAGDTISVSAETFNGTPGSAAAGIGYVASSGGSRSMLPLLSAGSTVSSIGSYPDVELLFNAIVDLEEPVVRSVAPASGNDTGGGTPVTIEGVHLAVATSVKFGDKPATILSAGGESITVVAPPGQGGETVDVTVTTAGGTSSAKTTTRFTYTDTISPELTKMKISRSRFAPVNFGGPIAAAKIGGRVKYTLSEDAKVTFTVRRGSKRGRRVGRPFTDDGAAGGNVFTFSGRVGRKALKSGAYAMTAVATDAAGHKSKTLVGKFTIVK